MTKYKFDYSDKTIKNIIDSKRSKSWFGWIYFDKCTTTELMQIMESIKFNCKEGSLWKLKSIKEYCNKMNLKFEDLKSFHESYAKKKKNIKVLEKIIIKEYKKERDRDDYSLSWELEGRERWERIMETKHYYYPFVPKSEKNLLEFITEVIKLKKIHLDGNDDDIIKGIWQLVSSNKEYSTFRKYYYEKTSKIDRLIKKE